MSSNLPGAKDCSRSKSVRDEIAERMSTEQIAEAQKMSREWPQKMEKYEYADGTKFLFALPTAYQPPVNRRPVTEWQVAV